MNDLFGAPTLVGLKVKLDRPVDRERPCCRNVCTIGAGRGPHAGELICSDCGQHRGWLSKSTAHRIRLYGKAILPHLIALPLAYGDAIALACKSRLSQLRLLSCRAR